LPPTVTSEGHGIRNNDHILDEHVSPYVRTSYAANVMAVDTTDLATVATIPYTTTINAHRTISQHQRRLLVSITR
jgi:hypothetical protein